MGSTESIARRVGSSRVGHAANLWDHTMSVGRTKLLLAVVLVCSLVPRGAEGRAKKGDEEEGGGDEDETCTTIYMAGYHGGTTTSHYVGYDHNQAEDNVTMLDALLNSNGCYSDTTGNPLPTMDSTCDDDDETSACLTMDFEWTCNMTNPATLATHLRTITKVETDDCENEEPKCLGAPIGAVTCTDFTALAAGQHATGLSITANGDRCKACSLNEDLCPIYYAVHNCAFEWSGITTTQPDTYSTFTMSLTVNSAPPRTMGPYYGLLLTSIFTFLWSL